MGETVTVAVGVLSKIVTSSMLDGLLAEITSLLPIIIPALIGFIAIRKGISFLIGTLRGA
jgi:hypothetical protein